MRCSGRLEINIGRKQLVLNSSQRPVLVEGVAVPKQTASRFPQPMYLANRFVKMALETTASRDEKRPNSGKPL